MTTDLDRWKLLAALVIALMALLALLPTYWMILASLRTDDALTQWPPALSPIAAPLTLDAWRSVLQQGRAFAWLMNSSLIAAGSVAVALLVSVPAAYALSRGEGRVLGASAAMLFLSKLLPASVLITPLYVMMRGFGLINSPGSVMLGNLSFAVPLATFFLKTYIDAVPREIDEAASIDGASRLRTLVQIVVPNLGPAISAVAIYVFIVSWNDFIFARTFLTGGDATTITVGTTMYMGEYQTRWNQLMVVGCMATLPCLAVFLILQKHLVVGLREKQV